MVESKVNLLKPQDKLIDVGHVPLGKATKRSLLIINSGKTPLKLQVNFMKQPPQETINPRTSSIVDSIKIHPAGVFALSPNKPQEVTIKFKPRRRMNSEEIIGAHIDSTFIPLSILRGKCLAPEFHLNRSIIQFGAITEGFTEEEKIVLCNSGDFTSKFKWNLSKLPHCFNIKPVEGISSAGSDVTFNIKFTPSKKTRRFEGKGIIEIENYKNIIVSFIGSSKPLPAPVDIINFTTPVRKEDQKHVKVENDLNIVEKIEITTFGNYFTADKFLNIPPKSSKSITVKYFPLVMTSENQFHKGKIVLRLLEQKSVNIYELKGSSSPPESLGKIVREVPAKKKHTELFSVENWDNKTQFFMTNFELTSPKGNEIFTFSGNDKIDVNARGRRSYQTVFHCFNESVLDFRVSFTSSESEYQFYEVEYKVTKPEILKTIELITNARTSTNYVLEVYNPLEDRTVNYSSVKYENSLDILIDGIPKILPPKSADKIAIQYLPVFPGESTKSLEVISEELGVFPYELKLKSLPPAPEKAVTVFTSLGISKKLSISVKNSSRATAEFFIRVEEPFTCKESRISIDSGGEEIVELSYEPSSVGKVERNVIVVSETAGEIVYPIVGIASLPKAQGPFTLTTKKPLTIPFKNVFKEAKTFQCVVDPTISFSTSSASNIIDPNQNANVVVSFKTSAGLEDDEKLLSPVTGKLVVYCTDPELCHLNWIYYLKGIAS
ncbi:hydrocephalus-inducing protein homolog [Diachasma alloeum]|uniref:hydrocephalus-inducing protein homolog n=1 Tax=Diachasma alloeum TaxID=454923 RepID=UPI0010FB4BAC|nr:hydrocephalus-inducing protein homolog [Diachasma alloeum]